MRRPGQVKRLGGCELRSGGCAAPMRLTSLTGLRLNCWLAPGLPLLLALGVALLLHQRHAVQAEAAAGAGLADTLALVAALHPEVAAVRQADPRWSGLARVRWVGDEVGLVILAAEGVVGLRPAEPPPALLTSVNGPAWWRLPAGGLAVAAVERDGAGNVTAFWYGEAPAPRVDWRPVVWASAVLALLGGLLVWYLARHLWRPIESLQHTAEAALRGEAVAPDAVSEETASLRTSILALAERSSSRGEGV